MKSIKLSIPEPCQEKWDDMSPTETGRYCMSCQKDIIDFTQMSDQQLINHIQQARGTVCGQMPQSKLNRYLIPELNRNHYSINLKAVVLGATLLVSVPVFSAENDLVTPEFSLVQSLIDDTRISVKQDYRDTTKISFSIKDDQTGEPAFGVKVIAYDSDSVMITGALSDFDGRAILRFTETQLSRIERIVISTIEYEVKTIYHFDTAERFDHYDIELSRLQSQSVMLGVVVVDHPRRMSRKALRHQRREKRRDNQE